VTIGVTPFGRILVRISQARINLNVLCLASKLGIAEAGGIPLKIPTIAV
jgi:hypothetical protein